MSRQFNYEWYAFKGSHSRKTDAQAAAKRLRKRGWKVRVVKGQTKSGRKGFKSISTKYDLWGRKK